MGGLKDGFEGFFGTSNIVKNVLDGFFGWIFGGLKPKLEGITLPSFQGIVQRPQVLVEFLVKVYEKLSGVSDLNLDWFKQALANVTGIDPQALLEHPLFKAFTGGNLIGDLAKHLEGFTTTLFDTLKDQATKKIIDVVIKSAITKIAGILATGGVPVTELAKAAEWLANKTNIDQLAKMFKDTSALVAQAVTGVVNVSSSQVKKATEGIFTKALPIALGFVASQFGAAGIPGKLAEIVENLNVPSLIYQLLSKLWAGAKASLSGLLKSSPAPLSGKVAVGKTGLNIWLARGRKIPWCCCWATGRKSVRKVRPRRRRSKRVKRCSRRSPRFSVLPTRRPSRSLTRRSSRRSRRLRRRRPR